MGEHVILHKMTSIAAGSVASSVTVVIPFGAVEQHSWHLPLGTDALIADQVARGVESILWDSVVLAPLLWVGASDHHLSMPGTASVGTDVLVATITGIVETLHRSTGWNRFLLLNGHGGNQPAERVALEKIRAHAPNVTAWAVDYWDAMFSTLDARGVGRPTGMGHADVIETSILLHCLPELVATDAIAPDGFGDGLPPWVHTTRGIPERTMRGGVGDPTAATKESGAVFLSAAVDGITDVVRRIAQEDGS